MNKLKTYFANLWAAILGRSVSTQGGGGPGEPAKK